MIKFVLCIVVCVCMTNVFAETGGSVNVAVSIGGSAVTDATVVVRSGTNASFEIIQKTNASGKVTVNGVPVGSISVYSMDNAGNVTAKYAGELISENENLNVALDY